MKIKRILICEDCTEGIFSAIYDAWDSRYGHDNIYIKVRSNYDAGMNLELFSEYINIPVDEEKAIKVANSIQSKISEEAYSMVCHAAWSNDEEKGDMIYRFLILGFSMGPKVVDYLSNDVVMSMFNMNRNVGNEAHHFTGFLRFTESQGNILLAKINPKNDILRLIAPHFSDRLGEENFLIYDEKRRTAIIHQKGLQWIYSIADNLNLERINELSEQEEEFQLLWKTFFNSIAIEERKNAKLQRNNLPKRFRSNITEFN